LDSHLDEYVIHKTYRGYPRIPSDIDTLVPNLGVAVRKLKSVGLKIHEYDEHGVMLLDTNGVKVHLNGEITWANSFFFDKELVLNNPRKANLWYVNATIPNINADFLTHVAHINFEPLHFTLSDFLYLCKLAPFVDWVILLQQVRKHNWTQSFTRTLSLIDDYNRSIYSPPYPFESLNPNNKYNNHEILVFPKNLPRTQIAMAFLEKKPFSYLLSKLSKSIQILATGDTYQSYYNPPELTLINEVLSNA